MSLDMCGSAAIGKLDRVPGGKSSNKPFRCDEETSYVRETFNPAQLHKTGAMKIVEIMGTSTSIGLRTKNTSCPINSKMPSWGCGFVNLPPHPTPPPPHPPPPHLLFLLDRNDRASWPYNQTQQFHLANVCGREKDLCRPGPGSSGVEQIGSGWRRDQNGITGPSPAQTD